MAIIYIVPLAIAHLSCGLLTNGKSSRGLSKATRFHPTPDADVAHLPARDAARVAEATGKSQYDDYRQGIVEPRSVPDRILRSHHQKHGRQSPHQEQRHHIDVLRPLLPEKYSPLQLNGNGIQSVYLTEVPAPLAEVLIGLIGQEVAPIATAARATHPVAADDLDLWERKLEQQLVTDPTVPETDRLAIVRARVGQGLFKERVAKIETKCRITGVENPVHLIASHCKPWRDATNEERLDGENGLLLTPSIDHLFDRGFIGFENDGKLIISPVAHRPSLQRMGIDTAKTVNVGGFTSGQKQFLDFHRNAVLLQAVRG